jgi:hypothetical protein
VRFYRTINNVASPQNLWITADGEKPFLEPFAAETPRCEGNTKWNTAAIHEIMLTFQQAVNDCILPEPLCVLAAIFLQERLFKCPGSPTNITEEP